MEKGKNTNQLNILHFAILNSTSDYAIDFILQNNINSDYAILADEQTSGRGRLNNRVWESPKGNFYCSYIINLKNLNLPIEKTNILTSMVISILKEFLNKITNSDIIKLKIPNDLLINDKKLSGVLIEVYYPYAIIGIGINLISSPISITTNIKDEFNILVKSEEIVENLYKELVIGIKECDYL
ncbi:MAG: biotin--[acetyl-CoA-carboxylase] ligase [Alphaproteobacteria bacterium]|nr:biotin--[acetyl-CoA-carboxylase] ligase [Alphaproteobacteria bacterium]